MNKKLISVLIIFFLALVFSAFQYMKEFQVDLVNAYTTSKPANGHSWAEMECTSGLCITGDNKVGIGTDNPTQKLSVAGIIESTSGGIKFPDGTVQTTKTVAGPAGATGPAGPAGSALSASNCTIVTNGACPAGKYIVGGSCSVNAAGDGCGGGDWTSLQSFSCGPSGNSWSCSANNNCGNPGRATGCNFYSVCCP